MTTVSVQQRARGFIQNMAIIVVVLLAVVAVYYYFFRRTIIPAEEPLQVVQVEVMPEPLVMSPQSILFQDTFESARDSWEISVAGQAMYDRGAMILNDMKFEGNAFARPHLMFDNFLLNVHTRWLGGAVGGLYGVRFRLQDNGNYYAFYLSNEGRYVIGKYMNDVWVSESGYSEAIALGGGLNLIQIEATGSTFRFFVNDVYIADLVDESLGAGDIEIVAEKSGDTNSFVVAFDNLTVARHPHME